MYHCGKFCLLILSAFIGLDGALAQTTQKTGTSSLSGQIKIGEKGAPGIVVALTSAEMRGPIVESSTRAVTDGEGRFVINNLAAGRFRVNVLAPGYNVAGNTGVVQISEGQSVSNLDFTLTKGGVITGRVTTTGDRPVIGEPVILQTVDENGQPARSPLGLANNFRTDDRGVYRIYGLPSGKYLLSVGRGEGFGGRGGRLGPGPGGASSRMWQRTYYPDTVESSQASAIEVEAGKEVTSIDIRMASLDTSAVTGRVVDAETGNPVAGVLIGHGRTTNRGNGNNSGAGGNGNNVGNRSNRLFVMDGITDGASNAEGEFRIEGLRQGGYAVYVAQDQAGGQTEFYSDPVSVDVSSSDVSGIEIKLRRGASISGVVAIEGASDPSVSPSNLFVSATVGGGRGGRGGGSGGGDSDGSAINMTTGSTSQVALNGSFRIAGLAPGRVNLNVRDQRAPGPFSGLTILRIERNGADARSGLQLEPGEQVTGVHIVLAYGASVVRGVVKVEGGTLTPNMRLIVFARRADMNRSAGGPMNGRIPAQVDLNGRFVIERLVPGNYEISVQMMGERGGPGNPQGARSGTATQTVVVGNNSVHDVVVPLNLTAPMTQQRDQNNNGRRGGRP